MAIKIKETGEIEVKNNPDKGKVAFLGGKKKSKWKKYENPGDGSIPGRYKDETLKDYKIRRNKGLREAMGN